MKDRRINGCALELIMRDVLDGMCDFTQEACTGSQAEGMDILGIDKAAKSQRRPTARIIPFPKNARPDRKR
jgi:hypothetical protein